MALISVHDERLVSDSDGTGGHSPSDHPQRYKKTKSTVGKVKFSS